MPVLRTEAPAARTFPPFVAHRPWQPLAARPEKTRADSASRDRSEARDPLGGIGVTLSISKGTTVFEEGDAAEHYFRVMSGHLRLYKLTEDGKRQIIAFLRPGQFFGLDPEETYQFSADALTASSVQRLPRAQIAALMRSEPDLGAKFFSVLRDQLLAVQQRLVLLGRKTAKARVASFLVMMSRSDGLRGPTHDVHLAMSRYDIADFLGLAVETVSRTFGELKEKTIIALPSPQHVAIRQWDALEEIADNDMSVAAA